MVDAGGLFVTGLGTGLIAGGASCAAVQGGLLAGAVTRRAAAASGRHRRRPQSHSVAPVAAFLAGKLASHTVLGAALGVFGEAIQPGPQLRAILLLAAAALMVLFALELLGVRALTRWLPRPPVAGMRIVRRSARSRRALAPLLLGTATVLVPCGVTLSVAMLAITSGSAAGGAAVLSGFVLGTAPLFAILGYLLRASTRVLQGRLRALTGLAIAAVAVWTLSSGLRLGGWTWSIGADPAPAAAPVVLPKTPTAPTSPSAGSDAPQKITLRVRDDAYTPRRATARAGEPVTLVLRTHDTTGCTRTFTIPSLAIERVLPKAGTTIITLEPRPPGQLRYTCGMGMYGGAIQFTG